MVDCGYHPHYDSCATADMTVADETVDKRSNAKHQACKHERQKNKRDQIQNTIRNAAYAASIPDVWVEPAGPPVCMVALVPEDAIRALVRSTAFPAELVLTPFACSCIRLCCSLMASSGAVVDLHVMCEQPQVFTIMMLHPGQALAVFFRYCAVARSSRPILPTRAWYCAQVSPWCIGASQVTQ